MQHDVDEGRSILDFSEWDRRQIELDEVVEVVREGEMPPLQYWLMHRGARLSGAERQELGDGLRATLGR